MATSLANVVVAGRGKLYDHVVQHLQKRGVCTFPLESILHGTCTVSILALDDWNPAEESALVSRLRQLSLPIFPMLGRMNQILLGPFELPDVPGCIDCLNIRWEHAVRRFALLQRIKQTDRQDASLPLSGKVSALDLEHACGVVVRELSRWSDQTCATPDRTVHLVTVGQNEIGRHNLLPSCACSHCCAPIQTAADALRLTSHSMLVPDRLRVLPLDTELLKTLYVNDSVGLITGLRHVHQRAGWHGVNAFTQVPGNAHQVAGYGTGQSLAEAEAKAILEALERSSAMTGPMHRRAIVGSFAQLTPNALHPNPFGFYDKPVYESAENDLEPFREDVDYLWVGAHSFAKKASVLVPLQLVSYGQRFQDSCLFVHDTSNGCALGQSPEEAILHGILEVIERDGLMNTWYGQLRVPQFKLDPILESALAPWTEELLAEGYDFKYFDMSLDLGLPNVLVVAINRAQAFPKIIASSCCHLNLKYAIQHALQELYSQLLRMKNMSVHDVDQIRACYDDPEQVTTVDHHATVAALPESQPRWNFLLNSDCLDQSPALRERMNDSPIPIASDIRVVLEAVIQRLFERGLDVLVVDQTTVELQAGNLSAVKVLIPGATPLSFGYRHQRFQGLTRLYELPQRLGYAPRRLEPHELNAHPHPLS